MKACSAEPTSSPDAFLQDLVSSLHGSVLALDCRHRVVLCNARWQDFNGLTFDDVAGRDVFDVLPSLGEFRGAFDRCLQGEVVKADRVRMAGADGVVKLFRASILPWRDLQGQICGLVLNSLALSSTEAREEAGLATSRLEDAVALAGFHVWEIDHATRLVNGWGARDTFFEGGLGYDDLADRENLDFVHPDDRTSVAAVWREQDAAHQDRRAEFRLNRTDHIVWVSASSRAASNVDGRPGRVLGVVQDITDRKLAELATLQANDAKSQFLAVMSHEIRTPLTGVLGMAQIMEADELPDVQRERLQILRQSGESLLNVLNDTLDLSKIEAGKLELENVSFDLEPLLRGALAPFEAIAAGKGVNLSLDLGDAAGGYLGDPGRIKQVIYNLLSNAVKFTQEGEISLAARRTSAGLRILVTDTGRGVAPEKLQDLFQAFTQADAATARQYGGSGLGLSICNALTEMMGGRIEVQSQPGEGTRFSLDLPLGHYAPGEPSKTIESVQAQLPKSSIRVLAADDNRVNRMVLQALFGQAGVEIVIVEDGAAVVEAWESGAWDVILMDVQMPVMDGLEATRYIRDREALTSRERTPIIGLTANAFTHQRTQYLAAGMDEHVGKPIDVRRLFDVIAAVT